MKDKLVKVMLVIASGVITAKAVKTLRYYKLQKDMYEEVEDLATDEK